jgi:NDP-sugar pyrophosphorylase family protein
LAIAQGTFAFGLPGFPPPFPLADKDKPPFGGTIRARPVPVKPSDLRAVIPVGGEAKRLKPLTAEVSKAVVRIFCKPMVEFAVAELAQQGVKNFVMGVKGYVNYVSLMDYFKDGLGFSADYGISPRIHVKYQPNVDDVGSADSVRINMEYFDIDGPVIVVQGDNLFDLDLPDLLSFHESKGAGMTVVLTPVSDVEGYGVADVSPDGQIRRFVEKPKKEEAPTNLANTGIYLLSPEVRKVFEDPRVVRMIRDKKRLDFGLDFIPFLIDSGFPVYGKTLKGEWFDVGTPAGYLQTMAEVLGGGRTSFYLGEPVNGLSRVWIKGNSPESEKRRRIIIDKVRGGKITLDGSVLIGRHCQIGDGTVIRNSCIDNFCVIGDGVTIENSSLMDRVVVGDGAEVRESIIGRHARIGSTRARSTWVVGQSVIGDDVTIGEGSIFNGNKVYPHKVLRDWSGRANEIVT